MNGFRARLAFFTRSMIFGRREFVRMGTGQVGHAARGRAVGHVWARVGVGAATVWGTQVMAVALGRRRARSADLALTRRVAGGDPQAARELLVRLLPHLRSVCRAMLTGHADAEDATQSAALKVLERVNSYRGEAKLERWARTVATRVCIDLMRRTRRLREVGNTEHAHLPAASSGIDELGVGDRLRRYLEQVPQAQAQAVVMRHALGYTVPEMAALLELPIDTVKSRLLYGRRALRKLIRRDEATAELRASLGGQDG